MAGSIKGITVEIEGNTVKLTKALADANKQIKNTQSALKDVEKALQLDPGNAELLAQKQKLLAEAVEATRDKLEKEKLALRQLQEGPNADKTTEQQKRLQQAINATTADLSKLEKQAAASASVLGTQMQIAGQKLQTVGKSVSTIGSSLTKSLSLPILALGTAAVKVASDFETSMSKVRALSGATGTELQALSDKARELGANTRFSASEAADAMGELALAGWDTQQMLGGIDGVLSLAAASGLELADSASIISMNLAAFNLEAEKSGHLADVLATAQAATTTEAGEMAAAWGNAATSFTQAGQSAETTTALLEGMASVGDRGAAAGTGLNSVLSQMRQNMKDGAIAIGEVSVQIMDANGNYRDMIDIISDVEAATEGLGTAERDAALGVSFNRSSMNSLKELLAAGSDQLRAYRDDLLDCAGAAEKMAEVMGDNLAGKVKAFESASQEMGIAWGSILIPKLTQGVEALKSVADRFASLDEGSKKAILRLAGIAAATGPVLTVVGKLTTGLGGLVTGVGKAVTAISGGSGLAGALTGLLGPAGPVIAGIAAFAGLSIGVVALINHIRDSMDPLKQMEESLGRLKTAADAGESARNVYALTEEYMALREQIDSGTLSAEEMEQVQERLREVRQQLAEATGNAAIAGGELSDALDQEIQKQQTLAEMEQDRADREVYAALKDGAKDYQTLLVEEARLQQQLADAQEKLATANAAWAQGDEEALEDLKAAGKDYYDWLLEIQSEEKEGYLDSAEGAAELKRRLDELGQKASALAGTELTFETSAEALDYIDALQVGMVDTGQSFLDASADMEEAQGKLDEVQDAIKETEQSVIDLVRRGVIPASEGANLLGVSEEALQRKIRGVIFEEEKQARKTAEMADATAAATEESEELAAAQEAEAKALEEAQKKWDDLVTGLQKVPDVVKASGMSISELAAFLYDADVSAEQFASGVESMRGKVVNGFKEIKDESEITAKGMAETLEKNLQATQNWGANLSRLWNSTTDTTVRAYINYLANQGPGEYANAIAEFANGGEAELQRAAEAWKGAGEQSAQFYAAGVYMNQWLVEQGAADLAQAATDAAGDAASGADMGSEIPAEMAAGITEGTGEVSGAATELTGAALAAASAETGWDTLGTEKAQDVAAGLRNGQSEVEGAARSLINGARGAAQAAVGSWVSIGLSMASGIAAGMRQGSSAITAAANAAVQTALTSAKAAAQINSPSHLFRDVIGLGIAEGIAAGIDKGSPLVARSLEALNQDALTAGQGSVTTNNNYTTSSPVINLTVNAAPGQDARTVAREAVRLLDREVRQRGAVYA